MRVLHVIDTLAIGGAEQSLLEILSRFRTYEPMMCHIYPGDTLKAAYQNTGIPVVSLNISGRYHFLQAINKLKNVVKKEKPDLIHTTLFRADIVGRLTGRLTRKPVVSSFVNESYHPLRKQALSHSHRTKLRVVQEIDRITAHCAQQFIAVSVATKQLNCAALGIPESKVAVIYRGRNPEPFLSVTEDEILTTRASLGIRKSNSILLNVARLLQRKGQMDLLQAMPTVLQHVPNAKLLIAGEGHDRPQLELAIRELQLENSVQLLGERNDIATLLQLADLFIFPSHYEGHPGALVEAMLAARPIIASDIATHRETLAGHAGQLTPLADSAALATSVIALLKKPAQAAEMGQRARQVALQKFDIQQVAQQHEDLYTMICKQ